MRISRRSILATAASSIAAAALRATPASLVTDAAPRSSRWSYRVVPATPFAPAGLATLRRTPSGLQEVHRIATPSLRLLLTDPGGHHLYAAHDSIHPALPAGSIQVHRINPFDGSLTAQMSRALALSATVPTGMALSPSGDLLVVAADGGLFSILPLHPGGDLQEVTAIRKELLRPAALKVAAPPSLTPMHFATDGALRVRTAEALTTYPLRPEWHATSQQGSAVLARATRSGTSRRISPRLTQQ